MIKRCKLVFFLSFLILALSTKGDKNVSAVILLFRLKSLIFCRFEKVNVRFFGIFVFQSILKHICCDKLLANARKLFEFYRKFHPLSRSKDT